jgi:hypothetical protein
VSRKREKKNKNKKMNGQLIENKGENDTGCSSGLGSLFYQRRLGVLCVWRYFLFEFDVSVLNRK